MDVLILRTAVTPDAKRRARGVLYGAIADSRSARENAYVALASVSLSALFLIYEYKG